MYMYTLCTCTLCIRYFHLHVYVQFVVSKLQCTYLRLVVHVHLYVLHRHGAKYFSKYLNTFRVLYKI